MMSSKKKAAAKGPFFFFMLDFRVREEARGKKFPGGMDQVMREAGPHWEKLDADGREAYKNRAQQYKKAPKQNYGEKYTSQGIAYSVIEYQQQKRMLKQDNIRKAIAELIETASSNNELETMEIVFISFNHFCKTKDEVYVPAEMAVLRYNLSDGMLDQLHEFINPSKLPLGLAYESSILSEETHQLPIPPNSLGESDFTTILEKLVAFIDYANKPTKKGVLLFADAKEIEMTESILNQFIDDNKSNSSYNLIVCPMNELFFQLKRATEMYGMDICTFPARTIADILLKKDPYEYTSGIACSFHEDLAISRFCALSRVIRWSYMISDSCCLDLGIDLIPGQHLPLNADTTLSMHLSETIASKSMSFVSTSDLTHVSMPRVTKVRSKSPFGGDDPNGSVIYSTRSATSQKMVPKKKENQKADISNNPFYSIDFNSSVASNKLLSDSGKFDKIKQTGSAEHNPFSRQFKMDGLRQPNELGLAGHGRGALLSIPEYTRKGPSGNSSGAERFFKGRGTSFISTASVNTSLQFSDSD